MNKHTPYPQDLTLDCRRSHRDRHLKRQLAWLAIGLTLTLLALALGIMASTVRSLPLTFLAGLIILAGLKSAHYLTRH